MKQTLFIIYFVFSITVLSAQGLTLFNDNYIHEIRFETVDTLIFINTENYQSVRMIFDGNTVNSVGLKQKGNISASHANNKMPLKVKTNKYISGQEFDGIREFTLNNSFQDPSMMREKMTYDLSLDMGLYGLRTAYTKVYMDNHYWGVYTIVEGKDEMYKHVFGNKDGDAIESTDYGDLCYYGANQSDYTHPAVGDRYIVDNGNATTAWSRLISMLDKANNTPNANYNNIVGGYLNTGHFARYQALNVYLLNFDSYIGYIGNQVYYYDENANIWQVVPWDFNASFGLWNTNNFNPNNFPLFPYAMTNGCVGSFISTNSVLKNYYLNSICDLLTYHADTVNLNNIIDAWKAQIQTAVYADWRKEFTNSDFNNATGYGYFAHNGEVVPAMKTFAKDRYETISQALNSINYNCTTPVSSIENTSLLTIFPNPTSEVIYFDLNKNTWQSAVQYQVINANGQVIQSGITNDNAISIQHLNSGLYFLKCFDDKGNSAMAKILKM